MATVFNPSGGRVWPSVRCRCSITTVDRRWITGDLLWEPIFGCLLTPEAGTEAFGPLWWRATSAWSPITCIRGGSFCCSDEGKMEGKTEGRVRMVIILNSCKRIDRQTDRPILGARHKQCLVNEHKTSQRSLYIRSFLSAWVRTSRQDRETTLN